MKCGLNPTNCTVYRCHKLMIRGFLARQLGPLADTLLEDTEEVLLPDTEPAAFRRYLDLVYGVSGGGVATTAGYGLEAEPALRDSIEELFLSSLSPVIQAVNNSTSIHNLKTKN